MSSTFDYVANAIQVALGALDQEVVPKIPEVLDAIQKLKDAKEQALAASASYMSEMEKLKKIIVDLEGHLAGKFPTTKPLPTSPEDKPFKSDAKHPTKTEILKKK